MEIKKIFLSKIELCKSGGQFPLSIMDIEKKYSIPCLLNKLKEIFPPNCTMLDKQKKL